MPKLRRVAVRSYRSHRLEILDDGGLGWVITVQPRAAAAGPATFRLRNSVPHGLAPLLEEAQGKVDRLLDGPVWSHAP